METTKEEIKMKNEKVVDTETKVVEEKVVEEKKGILTKLKNATIDKIPDKAKENIKKGAKALGIGVAGAALGALAYRKHMNNLYEYVDDSDTNSDTKELLEYNNSVDNQIEVDDQIEVESTED
jgi:galactokinase/mevalonate kinase-like predicted kinase